MIKLTLHGIPRTKKNSQRIIRVNGKTIIVQSKLYLQYERDCIRQITGNYKLKLQSAMNLCCHYYLPDKRSRDLNNLLASTQDILQKAGVIADDKYIIGLDGSRIMGVDKANPRVEIEIREVF